MNPVLVEAWRGDRVESFHRGALAIVDADGALVAALGDVERPVFPRSAIKVLQALPLVASGASGRLGLDDEQLALACASHGGEPRHVQTAAASPLHNNCSGKHAGFLCLACALHDGPDRRGWVRGYVTPEHPVMREVGAALQAATDVDLAGAPRGTDGCSIPTYGFPLRQLALGFARVATGHGLAPAHAGAAARLRAAVAAAPFMVAGSGRFDTRVMERLGARVFCKVGAEGVYCAALPQRGLGVAIKVDDGNNARAAEVVMAAVIEACVALDDAEAVFMRSLSDVALSNWNGLEVGRLRATSALRTLRV